MPLVLAIMICGIIFFPSVMVAFVVGAMVVMCIFLTICCITVVAYAFYKTAKKDGIKQAWRELVDLWKGNVEND